MRFSSYKLRGEVEWAPLRRGAWSKNTSVVNVGLRGKGMNIRDGHDMAMSLIEHCSLNTILSEGTKTEKKQNKQTNKKTSKPSPSPLELNRRLTCLWSLIGWSLSFFRHFPWFFIRLIKVKQTRRKVVFEFIHQKFVDSGINLLHTFALVTCPCADRFWLVG